MIPLIAGFAGLLLIAVAVVVDATAAYLQRQSLDTLADGAELRGADLGVQGLEVYRDGLGEDPLAPADDVARGAVDRYLSDVGAVRRYPGLVVDVSVKAHRVVVRLRAPADLPLRVPGSPERPVVGAVGSAAVMVDPG